MRGPTVGNRFAGDEPFLAFPEKAAAEKIFCATTRVLNVIIKHDRHGAADKGCTISNEQIAKEVRCCVRSVVSAIQKLNHYRLTSVGLVGA